MKIKTIIEVPNGELEVEEKLYFKEDFGDGPKYYCITFNENQTSHTELSVDIANGGCVWIDLSYNVNHYYSDYIESLKDKIISKDEFLEAYQLAVSRTDQFI